MKAQKTLDDGEGDMYESLKLLADMADKLEAKRYKHGSIKFNSKEVIGLLFDIQKNEIKALASTLRYNPNHIKKEDIPKSNAVICRY